MAVEVQHFALEAGEGDDVQFAQVHAAFFVVVGFFAQGRRQSQQEFIGRDAPDFLRSNLGRSIVFDVGISL